MQQFLLIDKFLQIDTLDYGIAHNNHTGERVETIAHKEVAPTHNKELPFPFYDLKCKVHLNPGQMEKIEDFLGKLAALPLQWKIYPQKKGAFIRSRGMHDCPISALVRHCDENFGRRVNVSVSCARIKEVYMQVGLCKLTANVIIACADGDPESRYYHPQVHERMMKVLRLIPA